VLCDSLTLPQWAEQIWGKTLPHFRYDTRALARICLAPPPAWSHPIDQQTPLASCQHAIILGAEENLLTILERKTKTSRGTLSLGGIVIGTAEVVMESPFAQGRSYWVARCEVTPGKETPEPDWQRIVDTSPPEDAPPWPWQPDAIDTEVREKMAAALDRREEKEWWR
jgi:hypothetical protein